MAKINLLPQEFRVQHNVLASGLIVKGAALVLIIIMAFLYLAFVGNYYEQKKELSELKSKMDKSYPALANLNILKKTKLDLEQLNKHIQGLESERVIWSRCLSVLKENTPEGVYIGEISTGEADSFIIVGQTDGFSLIGDFYLNLKDCPDLADFSIQIVEDRTPEGNPLIMYILKGRLQKGGVK